MKTISHQAVPTDASPFEGLVMHNADAFFVSSPTYANGVEYCNFMSFNIIISSQETMNCNQGNTLLTDLGLQGRSRSSNNEIYIINKVTKYPTNFI